MIVGTHHEERMGSSENLLTIVGRFELRKLMQVVLSEKLKVDLERPLRTVVVETYESSLSRLVEPGGSKTGAIALWMRAMPRRLVASIISLSS